MGEFICIFVLTILYSFNDRILPGKEGNIPFMPVITNPHYYDNKKQYTDQSGGHPVDKKRERLLSDSVAGGVPGVIMLVDMPNSGTLTIRELP